MGEGGAGGEDQDGLRQRVKISMDSRRVRDQDGFSLAVILSSALPAEAEVGYSILCVRHGIATRWRARDDSLGATAAQDNAR